MFGAKLLESLSTVISDNLGVRYGDIFVFQDVRHSDIESVWIGG